MGCFLFFIQFALCIFNPYKININREKFLYKKSFYDG